jgi:site-specific DNA-methyltransferase (adenine-specific)
MADRFVIHHGDSLAVLRSLPDGSIDAVITDPPYSSGGMFRGDRTKDTGDKYVVDQGQDKKADFMGDNRDQRSFGYWCALWLSECHRAAKPGALLAVFCDWRQLPTMTDAVQSGGWVWRGIVPWNKTESTRPTKGWFRSQCEYLIVAAKGIPALYDHTGKSDAACLAGFFVCPVERDTVHQTQKPVSVMRWLCGVIPKGGVVLDPFAGSGTTGVGALLEGRDFIGCELSEHYVAIARRRCAIAAQQGTEQSIFENDTTPALSSP